MKGYARVLFVVAAVAAPPAFAQPELERVSTNAAVQLTEQISEIEAQGGPNAAGLVPPLTGLALIHHENGAYDLALATVERARGIVSINYGLYSLEEVPLLRQAVQSREAWGDFATAWDLEQELLALVARHPNDPRTAPVYLEVGAKRVDILERYYHGELPPQIIIGCYYSRGVLYPGALAAGDPSGVSGCRAGSKGVAMAGLRGEASYYYRRAIRAILQNDDYSSDELKTLLAEILPAAYRNDVDVNASAVYRHMLDYEVENPVSPASRADTLLEVADWNLLTLHRCRGAARPMITCPGPDPTPEQHEAVLKQYALALEEFQDAGLEREAADEIFSPRIPAVLPAFLPNPLDSERAGATGYIDVAFDVTARGFGENVEILDSTKSVLRRHENDLVKLIEESSFRPRATDGNLVEAARVTVRYYVRASPP
jgi:hypothetical protein